MAEQDAAQDAPDVTTLDPTVEREARDYGWAPEADFKGPRDKWKPATEFIDWAKQSGRLKRGEIDELKRIAPAMRQENKELKDKLAGIETTLKEFVEFSNKAEERAYNRAKQELEGKVHAAASNADPAAAAAAMRELEALKPPAPKPEVKETKTPNIDPVIQDWIGRERWFNPNNPALHGYASEQFGILEREKPGMSVEDMLAETKRLTIEKFPEKFGVNPKRNAPAAVGEPNGGAAPRKKNGRSYEDLPADAKAACDRFVKTIPNYTREQYVKNYEWD